MNKRYDKRTESPDSISGGSTTPAGQEMHKKISSDKKGYFGGLFYAMGTLMTGMKVTITEFFTKKVTERYPENRDTLVMFDRFRGTLCMPHDEEGNHKCIACGLCQNACPNDTIEVISESITNEEGKKKKVLVRYEYNLGSCMFCQLCVNACPYDAIAFDQKFEHAVYEKEKLNMILNKQ